MIIGVGIDVVDVERFVATLDRTPGLREKLFTPDERSLPPASLAARFAAKESFSKALGTGIWREGICFTDIEISVDVTGRPTVLLHGAAQAVFERLGGDDVSVSISHDGDLAVAMCVMEFSRGERGVNG